MRFKLGLLIGGAVGYYFGTKAGRERYEEIRRAMGRIADNERVQAVTERAHEMVEDKVETATTKLREVGDS